MDSSDAPKRSLMKKPKGDTPPPEGAPPKQEKKLTIIKRKDTSKPIAAATSSSTAMATSSKNNSAWGGAAPTAPFVDPAIVQQSASNSNDNRPKSLLKKKDKPTPAPAPADPSIVSSSAATDADATTDGAASEAPTMGPSERTVTSSSLGGSNYEQCDLCQCDCPDGELEAHILTQHKDLMVRVATLTQGIMELKANPSALKEEVLTAFGQYIEADVAPSDQGETVFKRALAAHDQVSRLVARRFPQCQVYMFGSTVAMGSWDGSGDVDLTLVDPKGWDTGKWPGKGDAEGNLILRLAGICREAGFDRDDLEPLRRVRVPVLKHKRPIKLDLSEHTGTYAVRFKFDRPPKGADKETVEKYFDTAVSGQWQDDVRYVVRFNTGLEAFNQYMASHRGLGPHQVFWDSFASAPEMFGVDFDLSTRAHGIRNSWLLRKYMEQSSLVRVGSVFLKHWSKVSGVNYSMKGYFTSYATNMLWVYFLLRRKLVTFIDPINDVEGSPQRSPTAPSYIPLITPEDKASPAFARTVAATIYDFFCFYAYEFDWDIDVVSICRDTLTTKESLGWTEDKEVRGGAFRDRVWYRVCIEDPFEANLNLGRHASIPKALKIRSQFFRAALTIVKGDFHTIMQDNSTNAAMERLQRIFPRVMLSHCNNASLADVLAGITEVDPDVLAAVETEYTVDKLAAICGCEADEDGNVMPVNLSALVNSSFGEEVIAIDAEVAAAGAAGLPITVLHDVNNVHPLYFSSPNSKRLFASSKAKSRFDEHLEAIKAVLPASHDRISTALKEKIAKVDAAIVATILKDERFFAFDAKTSTFALTKKALDDSKNQKETMDVASKQMGNCDECGKRSAVYGSSKGGRAKYCEPCWKSYSGN